MKQFILIPFIGFFSFLNMCNGSARQDFENALTQFYNNNVEMDCNNHRLKIFNEKIVDGLNSGKTPTLLKSAYTATGNWYCFVNNFSSTNTVSTNDVFPLDAGKFKRDDWDLICDHFKKYVEEVKKELNDKAPAEAKSKKDDKN